MKKLVLIVLLIIPQWLLAQKFDLTIRAENLKVSDGKMFVAVFNVREQAVTQEVVDFKNRQFEYLIKGLEKGMYAVKIFVDTNRNKKLDTNLVGYPKEPFGLSNISGIIIAPPKFKQMLFELDQNKKISIFLHE